MNSSRYNTTKSKKPRKKDNSNLRRDTLMKVHATKRVKILQDQAQQENLLQTQIIDEIKKQREIVKNLEKQHKYTIQKIMTINNEINRISSKYHL
jgi:hypothetical protein